MRLSFPLVAAALGLCAVGVAAQETGDSVCTSLVCISAVKTPTKVTYTLSRTPASQLEDPGFGWIAVGWGTTMANSPMTIAWPNPSENSITLSQRSSRAQIQPTESTPPAQATLERASSFINYTSLAATSITFSFQDNQAPALTSIIWAYSTTNPGSTASNANLNKHKDSGTTTLDLTKVLVSSGATATRGLNETATATAGTTAIQRTGKPVGTSTNLDRPRETRGSGGSNSATSLEPYTDLQKVLIAHATFGGLGAMIMIPAGVLVARLLRCFWPYWVKAHYMIHVALSLPFIAIAFGLGIHATNLSTGLSSDHFFSDHRALGLALFLLMVFQIAFGTLIHIFPAAPHGKATVKGKSIQNWLHPVVGIAILLIGWATCWTGFDEWELWSGLREVPTAVRVVWGILLGLFALLYLAGLVLLPRQFRQATELRAMQGRESREMVLQPASRDRLNTNPSTGPTVSPIDEYKDRSFARGHDDDEMDGKATTPVSYQESHGADLPVQFSNQRGGRAESEDGRQRKPVPRHQMGIAF